MEKIMESLPRWNLESIYSSTESSEFKHDLATIQIIADKLRPKLAVSTKPKNKWFISILEDYQNLSDYVETLYTYASVSLTVDTKNEKSLNALNRVEKEVLTYREIHVQFLEALKREEKDILELLESEESLKKYKFVIKELLEETHHTLTFAEESLAADLNRSGTDAFSRLQEAISSNGTTDFEGEEKSVIQLRALAFDKERTVRQKAYEAELSVWKMHEIAFAASLNGVKGTTLTLDKRRKFKSPLERSLIQARINKDVLEALITTLQDSLPLFRRYLNAKAKALNLEKLAFFDLFAPVGEASKKYSYDEGKQFILDNFATFSPKLATFAKSAYDKEWIDSEPRVGKVGGAYCAGFPLRKETRILANYDYSFDGVSTIAHELGHAYHDLITSDLPALLRHYPMTLAETASIFSQFIIFQGALKEASEKEQISLIESFLQDSNQVCVDILSRFYFEKEVFELREEGELSPNQFCLIMEKAQKATYGDALDEKYLHPYMWAVKGHYYSSELSFYNYPYAFGQLFALSLYALSKDNEKEFVKLYDELLLYSGQESAQKVVESVGFDISKKEFWQKGIAVIETYVNQFCQLVGYDGT
jgi:oligoendopeptidase F